VLEKYKGQQSTYIISNILNATTVDEDLLNCIPEESTKLKYAKITFYDVERSLTKYKNV
jgi:hypothetical protein